MKELCIDGKLFRIDDDYIYSSDYMYCRGITRVYVGIPISTFFNNIDESIETIEKYIEIRETIKKLKKLLEPDFSDCLDILDTQNEKIAISNGLSFKRF